MSTTSVGRTVPTRTKAAHPRTPRLTGPATSGPARATTTASATTTQAPVRRADAKTLSPTPVPTQAPTPTAPSPTAARFLRWSRRVAVTGWLGLIVMVVWGVQSGTLTSVTRLRDVLEGFGPVAPIAYALIGATEAVFPVIPGSATVVAAPILFGPALGVVTAYAATCLGSIAVFALARHVGQDVLHVRFRPATVDRWLGWLEHRHFTRWFAVAIALPVAPDDLLCYLAGLSQMRWRTFVLVILLLKPWALIIYTFGVLTLLSRWIPWLAG